MSAITLASKRRRAALRTAAFMSPWLIGFAVFFAYPLISTVYFSFMHYDGFKPPTWSGTKNWTYVFEHYPLFWPALRNTLWLVLVMVTLRVVFGLGVGMLITKIKTGTGVFRTLFYLPYLAPPVAATMAFAFLLNPGTGPVNSILEKIGIPAPGWFNDPAWSKPALTLLALWGVGDLMVIFMAALLDVPKEQYEAAELDGAGPIRVVTGIKLPALRGAIVIATIFSIIGSFQLFNEPNILRTLAPNIITTYFTPNMYAYNLSFAGQQYNASATVAIVMGVITAVIAYVVQLRGSRKEER
jgi:multiple sugar transport system permease protein